MKPVREIISFWINIISFLGSIIFIAHLMVVPPSTSDENKEVEQQIEALRKHIDSVITHTAAADTLR
jgi:hypothetical protein